MQDLRRRLNIIGYMTVAGIISHLRTKLAFPTQQTKDSCMLGKQQSHVVRCLQRRLDALKYASLHRVQQQAALPK